MSESRLVSWFRDGLTLNITPAEPISVGASRVGHTEVLRARDFALHGRINTARASKYFSLHTLPLSLAC